MENRKLKQSTLDRWIGRRFGRWTVTGIAHCSKAGLSWACKCDCGNTGVIDGRNLRSGNSRSCGCYSREVRSTTSLKHGKSYSRVYRMWVSLFERGSLSLRWQTFENFYQDMSDPPSPGHYIWRRDVGADFSLDNCFWKEGIQPRATDRRLTADGVTLSVKDWAAKIGISARALRLRLHNGWPLEEALTRRRTR